ncbi:hypothetical protein ACVIWV_002832 [Bradyrhizobium diazoefficiens]
MQNIFAPGGLWETPWMDRVLPAIADIASRYQVRTVFSRYFRFRLNLTLDGCRKQNVGAGKRLLALGGH